MHYCFLAHAKLPNKLFTSQISHNVKTNTVKLLHNLDGISRVEQTKNTILII